MTGLRGLCERPYLDDAVSDRAGSLRADRYCFVDVGRLNQGKAGDWQRRFQEWSVLGPLALTTTGYQEVAPAPPPIGSTDRHPRAATSRPPGADDATTCRHGEC